MARDIVDAELVESRERWSRGWRRACKPPSRSAVGTEHEKIPFYRADRRPCPTRARAAFGALLEGMRARLGWEPIEDGDNLIGLFDADGGGAISLEPGGQFELSGAPLETIHETAERTRARISTPRTRSASRSASASSRSA